MYRWCCSALYRSEREGKKTSRSHAEKPQLLLRKDESRVSVKTPCFGSLLLRESEQISSLICWEFLRDFRLCCSLFLPPPCFRFMLPQTLPHTRLHTARTTRMAMSTALSDSKIHPKHLRVTGGAAGPRRFSSAHPVGAKGC